ncbi:MAG: hypothetical protein EAZ55_09090 [Cytophagales bacterium]|nr:MAG: hypothetical protein EAZ55_09090 [Cytophagales bacterium]
MTNAFLELLKIGVLENDHIEVKLQKQFLVFLAIFMSMGGIVWGSIGFAFGLYLQATIPYGYTVISIFNLWYFYKSKHFFFVKTLQTSISLLLPFFFQWSLGGFAPSGAIMFWAILALLASITFQSSSTSFFWLACFLALTIFSVVFDAQFFQWKPAILPAYSLMFLGLNMSIIPAIVFGLMLYIVKKQEATQLALQKTQEEITAQNQALNVANEKLNKYGEDLEKIVQERTQNLKESEEKLQENVIELRLIQKYLESNNQKQQILNQILSSSLQEHDDLDDFLSKVIQALSSITFMKMQPGIGIFLRKNDGTYELRAQKSLSPQIQSLCKNIKEGQCLCGLAAQTKTVQYAHCIDERHTTTFEGIKEHGHYNLPIMLADEAVGVLVVYLAHGHQRNEQEIEFLETVCYIIADTIAKINARILIEEQNNILQSSEEELKQNLEELQATQDQLQKNLAIVESQRDEIVSSINYARRIQTALLPKRDKIQLHIPDLLLYYVPKDIVSGDFYWFSNHQALQNEVILAVVDCTGHGVSGAFMTVISESLLDQIVNKDQIFSPAQILTELDNRLLKTLQQQTRGKDADKVNDGMDIIVLRLNLAERKVVFAGAKRPLWIFEQNKEEITEYKGDKFPIGSGQFEQKIFTEKAIDLQAGDMIYAFTDGYADQFGTEGKLTVRRFRSLINEIYTYHVAAQEKILDARLMLWKSTEKQTDDVLVLGVKVP